MGDLTIVTARHAGFSESDAKRLLDVHGLPTLTAAVQAVVGHGFTAGAVMAFVRAEGPVALKFLNEACAYAKSSGVVPAKVAQFLLDNPQIARAFWNWCAKTLPGVAVRLESAISAEIEKEAPKFRAKLRAWWSWFRGLFS